MAQKSIEEILQALGGQRHIHYTLDRIQVALKSLGNPEREIPSILIGGTNGKGTTTLFVSSTLVQAGYKVATYLSPHLHSPSERLLLDRVPISEEELSTLGRELEPTAKRYELTYFEFLTLLFFVWAKRRHSEFLVVEVGLGGRLDATNVTDPLASLITNIGLDHQEYLGQTLTEILDDKMDIFRPEALVFTGIEDPELLARVKNKCHQLDAIYYLSKELKVSCFRRDWKGQETWINGYPFYLSSASTGTLKNAALAFLFVRIVFPKLPIAILQEAFQSTLLPGRMEVVQESPRVVLSADHNPHGLASLLSTLSELEVDRLHILAAFSPDKPFVSMYRTLAGIGDSMMLTQIPHLQKRMPKNYFELGPFLADPCSAMEAQLKTASPNDTILVTGSTYLIGEVRSLWRSRVEFVETQPKSLSPVAPSADVPKRSRLHTEGPKQSPSP